MKHWRGWAFIVIVVTFLSLSLITMNTYNSSDELLRLGKDFVALEQKTNVRNSNWSNYLEQRMNRVAQSQDEYQMSTSKRVDNLEKRIKKLEQQ